MKANLAAMCTLASMVAAAGAADWPAINAAAREQAKAPVRAGVPGERPFWNAHARAFIHPPAFDFPEADGAEGYRFALAPESGGTVEWTAEKPWLPVPGETWDALAPGYYTLRVEALMGGAASGRAADSEARQNAAPPAAERRFYRAAIFHGPYPEAPRDYREAAVRVYASVFNLPYVQAWLDSDDPPEGYDLYCYPAKILASMIRALCRHAASCGDPAEKERALAIACRMADWLIAHSQPGDAPLAHFPPTYWGDRRDVAVKNAGLNMLSYPAHAALAYFELADALEKAAARPAARASGEAAALAGHYRDAALAIVRTYVRLQGEDGTWWLKVRESDGAPMRQNRLVPNRYLFGMFDRAIEAVGGVGEEAAAGSSPVPLRPAARESGEAAALADSRDRAFAYVERGPLATWNWDGQFEDMDPMPPYQDLQKGVAIDTALRLFALGRNAEACELVDWCEDQFTVWSDPIHHMDYTHWKTPTALEQYDYYTPIDASMGDMVRGFAAAYRATGNPLYREKAKALADNLVRNQRADGTIPTYFDSRGGSDWVNCMVYSASCLELAADLVE